MKSVECSSYTRYLAIIPLLTTIIVTPGLNTESQILGKFTFFTLSVVCAFIFAIQRGQIKFGRLWGGLSLAIIASITVSTLIQRQNLSEQLYGVYGRNNGLILIIASILYFLMSVSPKSEVFESLVLKRLTQTGWFVVAYFFIQFVGWDLVPWNKTYDVPVSTLGNPNFLSAFIALSLFANFGDYMIEKRNKKSKVMLAFSWASGSLALFLTNSQQGFLLLLAGIWMLLCKFLFERKSQALKLTWTALTGSFIGIIILGIANIGPGQRIFQEYTLAIRREYWLAGISMYRENPIFGNGIDSYLYNFDAHKSDNFVKNYGIILTSSSSHNIYIDYFQGAGLFAGLLYLMLNLLVTIVAVKRAFKGTASQAYWALFIIWILIQIQSLISIQNVAINSWQWLIAAALVATSQMPINKSPGATMAKITSPNQKKQLLKPLLIALAIPIIYLIPLAFIQDVKFAGAIKTSNGSALIDLSNTFPFDTYRSNYTARALEEGKYWHFAREIAKNSVIENPRNKEGWLLIYKSKLSTTFEKQRARREISKLDPRWEPS